MSVFTVSHRSSADGRTAPYYMLSCYASGTFSPGQCQVTPPDEIDGALAALRRDGHEVVDLDDPVQAAGFVERRDAAYAARRAA